MFEKNEIKMGMMAYAYNLSTSETESRRAEDMDRLSYIVRSRPNEVYWDPASNKEVVGGEANTHSPYSTKDLIILKQYLRQSYSHVPGTELHR